MLFITINKQYVSDEVPKFFILRMGLGNLEETEFKYFSQKVQEYCGSQMLTNDHLQ